MQIRELIDSELEQLLALYAHLIEKDEDLPDPEIIRDVWGQIVRDEKIRYFGMFDGDVLISTCNITLVPNLTRGCRPYGLIENVVTHREYRRQGFGKAILQKAIDYAWDHNCYKVMLLTGRKSEETFRFYEAAGFDRHGKQGFIIRK